MGLPTVSVVMSVYNGAEHLRASLESILGQSFTDFEFLIVNDGSTDQSAAILAEYAAGDARIRVIDQENQGLTKALIRGCGEARGEFIARHDSDDLTLPGRLARQAAWLESHPETSFVCCWSYGIGPEAELLFEVRRSTDARDLLSGILERGEGPPGHGSVMFRAEAYRQVGEYRAAFRYAQDWDLWLRLAEVGQFACVPEFGYAFRISESSISSFRRRHQCQLSDIAQACRAARLGGESETALLAEAARVSVLPPPPGRKSAGTDSYFIGKCLLERRDRRSLAYLVRGLRAKPWSLRRWFALGAAAALCHGHGETTIENLSARRLK